MGTSIIITSRVVVVASDRMQSLVWIVRVYIERKALWRVKRNDHLAVSENLGMLGVSSRRDGVGHPRPPLTTQL
jgi:hypothetical protein